MPFALLLHTLLLSHFQSLPLIIICPYFGYTFLSPTQGRSLFALLYMVSAFFICGLLAMNLLAHSIAPLEHALPSMLTS